MALSSRRSLFSQASPAHPLFHLCLIGVVCFYVLNKWLLKSNKMVMDHSGFKSRFPEDLINQFLELSRVCSPTIQVQGSSFAASFYCIRKRFMCTVAEIATKYHFTCRFISIHKNRSRRLPFQVSCLSPSITVCFRNFLDLFVIDLVNIWEVEVTFKDNSN